MGCLGKPRAEHGRLAPQDLRSRQRRHRHGRHLDVDASLVTVNFQEHVPHTQGGALLVCDDDLNPLHIGNLRGSSEAESPEDASAQQHEARLSWRSRALVEGLAERSVDSIFGWHRVTDA